MKKTGIMGGTFNPIHFGHLFLAENAYEQVGLDQILFMPTKNPPHKKKPISASDDERMEMIRLAIKDNPHFTLSTLELERDGTTYTADTLTILTRENPDIHYYFIVGSDSLFMMQNWKAPQIIFDKCTIVAAARDKIELEQLKKQSYYLQKQFRADIRLLDMPIIQISSVEIRNRINSRRSVRYYLPDEVINYIMKNHLYVSAPEDHTYEP